MRRSTNLLSALETELIYGQDRSTRTLPPYHVAGRMSKRKLTLSLAHFRQTAEAIPRTYKLPAYKR